MAAFKTRLTKLYGDAERRRRLLEIIFQISQISLAVVAIFGYFYTVRPIYQKERLAEQVAEYDGIIKKQAPRIAEIELRLAALQRERERVTQEALRERERLTQDAERDRTRLTTELKSIERQLVAAREGKSRIERQTQFMAYRYYLPDGTPAVTNEQVKTAQLIELRQLFLSSLYTSCTLGLGDGGPFRRYATYVKREERDKSWPFTERELSVWKEHGARYPLKRAIECIDSVAARQSQQYARTNFLPEIERLRKDAVDYANRAAANPWPPPMQPEDVLRELAAGQSTIEKERIAEVKKVEEEYGDWESVLLPDRREIFKNNYRVGKQNAEMQALSKRFSLESKVEGRAQALRTSISEEVKRLIVSDNKGDAK